ncbi:hypothetical protein [Capnocytophaga gingivalis]
MTIRILYLFLLLLPQLLQAQTLREKLSLADKEYHKDNYQQVVDLLKGEDFSKTPEALYWVIQARFALLQKDYSENIVKFDYNRLSSLRTDIATYKALTAKNKKARSLTAVEEVLEQYPPTELDFIVQKIERAEGGQMQQLKEAFESKDYDQVLQLAEEFHKDKVLRPFVIDYYRLMAAYKKINLRKASRSEKEQLYNQFKAYKEAYHHKNILYDQAVEAALRELQ